MYEGILIKIIGPTGSGKTTLAGQIAGLLMTHSNVAVTCIEEQGAFIDKDERLQNGVVIQCTTPEWERRLNSGL